MPDHSASAATARAQGRAQGRPLVSVCLVTWEAERWLDGCVGSVLAQSYPTIELVIRDNGSGDGTATRLASVATRYPSVSWTPNAENIGFARAQNQAIAAARGEYICLLNQDVVLDARFLASAAAVLDRDPSIGSVQGRVRRLGAGGERLDLIDTTGLVVLRDRRFLSRGQGDPDGPAYAVGGAVFGADGPCPVYRRAALDAASEPRRGGGWEVLDEDFFLYHEDTDLAWRLRLLGWEAWYEPSALAWHARGVAGPGSTEVQRIAAHRQTLTTAARRHGWKNHRLMQVKNESWPSVRRDLVPILRREAGSLVLLVLTAPRDLVALAWFARFLPAALRKRRWIQRHRRSSPTAITSWFSDE